uniref:ATP synthase complex subunit 8 n=2 Tax=Trichiurus TaxID=13732 RepID=A0A6B9QKP7_9SCOM|nr:ATP synthase F0 subunit 8 [Trichiurus haumela]QBX88131.1 ATP synthase F0 subunit 8 [Trichiurus haumela]QHF17704.1 ATP synthase F0 subunit 8 [Trichiurus japonicus]UNZ13130.1 ATP synthase F0 subunit 8 [Trichiurus japonicus]WNH24256.1 ATP synthase F0 subunit 8 [Trichiurus lepturus]
MPQLKPSPWVHIFMLAWTSFLVILPCKIISFIYPSSPDTQEEKTASDTPWTWQWQ